MTDMREAERERIGRLANEICGCSTLEQHRRDIALIEAEIDRRVAEERAKLLERLREPTHEMVRRLNAACDTPDVQMTWVFPYVADMLAQFEKEQQP